MQIESKLIPGLFIKRYKRFFADIKINKKNIEFQMLYGVPMDNVIKKLMAQNFKIRIYVPYGKNWYDYSIRRIKENPNISKYIIKNLFK